MHTIFSDRLKLVDSYSIKCKLCMIVYSSVVSFFCSYLREIIVVFPYFAKNVTSAFEVFFSHLL